MKVANTVSRERAEVFNLLTSLSGKDNLTMSEDVHRGYSSAQKWCVNLKVRERCAPVRSANLNQAFVVTPVTHDGVIWCPVTPNKTWFARRKGSTYYTGNTSAWSQDADLILGVERLEETSLVKLRVVAGRNVSLVRSPCSAIGRCPRLKRWMISMTTKKTDAVEEILDQLGINVVSAGKEISAHCPFHADAHPSFSINASSGLWICYQCSSCWHVADVGGGSQRLFREHR